MTELEPPRRSRRRLVIGAAAVAAVLVVVATVLVVQRRANDRAAIEEAARAATAQFTAGWAGDDFTGVAFAGPSDAEVTAEYRRLTDGLGSFAVTIQPGPTVVTDEQAVVDLALDWTLVGGIHWRTDTRVELERQEGVWRVKWSPRVVHPDLTAETRLVAERIVPNRGPILAADGQALVADRPVVDVGVQPSRVDDIAALSATLGPLLGIDAQALAARVAFSPPEAFVSVITLRRADYDAIRDQLQPLPGTMFRERDLPLAPNRVFARALLGTSGDVTAEIVDASNGRYRAGDIAGLSGLQRRYDKVLAGSLGVNVFVAPAPPPAGQEPDPAAPPRELVFDAPAVDGRAVKTTIDPDVQIAADQALAATTLPSSLVVIRPSTGEILAVANGPDGGTGENLAFTGQYPPGSSFKVVSTEALLGTGLTPTENVDCPATIDVGGRSFRNAENEVFGRVPFRQDFASSCNTAFVELSKRLDDTSLTEAGARFGLGGSWSPGMPAFTGTVPTAEGPADLASATFGQGRVLVSPLAMAMVGATVADGTWRAPVLVSDPADPGASTAAGDASATTSAQPEPIAASSIETLRSLMREVVVSGTGDAVRGVPGAPVSGKTGTAEFGTDVPPRSHAWFIGFQGDLAFAVFVEGGEFGGETAAPIAADLLTRLASE